uniref:CARD domain-containing protein n=1 Tax=Periophthalmus magnuspinnatus TaxID=409849 RepID=A0A3B4ABG7_9GOBI
MAVNYDKGSSGELLRGVKAQLISILSSQADFVLQHADSRSLVTPQGYRQIKSCRIPDEKMRDLLDHIIERGPKAAQGLLELLKDQELQETFPKLNFIKSMKRTRKQKKTSEMHEVKQLMSVARAIGQAWREVAIMALEIPSVRLEQIVADNPNCQVNQVFVALRYWKNIQGNKATATYLHSLLCQKDLALSQDVFNFLLENK